MKTANILLIVGAGALAFVALRGKPAVAQITSGQYTGLNSGIYNPLYNPGGSTNYTGSFAGMTPATGYVTYYNAPNVRVPTAIR